jgi:hypothetical protein
MEEEVGDAHYSTKKRFLGAEGRLTFAEAADSNLPSFSDLFRAAAASWQLGWRPYTCVVLLVALSTACRVLSCPVVFCRVLSCPVVSCRVLSCPVVSCRVLSLCPVGSSRVEPGLV